MSIDDPNRQQATLLTPPVLNPMDAIKPAIEAGVPTLIAVILVAIGYLLYKRSKNYPWKLAVMLFFQRCKAIFKTITMIRYPTIINPVTVIRLKLEGNEIPQYESVFENLPVKI